VILDRGFRLRLHPRLLSYAAKRRLITNFRRIYPNVQSPDTKLEVKIKKCVILIAFFNDQIEMQKNYDAN